MKVASILEDARWGGPQSRLLQTTLALELYQVNHTVLIPKANNERLRNALNNTSVKIVEIKIYSPRRGFKNIVGYLLSVTADVFRISYALKKNDIDILHVQGGSWQIKGSIAAFIAGKKVVWHLNDTNIPGPVKNLFILVALISCDIFIVQGDKVRSYYLSGVLRKKRFEKMYGIVDEVFYEPIDQLKRKSKFTVATVATATPNKNYMRLIEVAKTIKAMGLDIDFNIVGRVNPNHRQYYDLVLEKRDEYGLSNVHFLGECFDVKSFLEKCHIYLCCSNNEASPTSIWESMASGIPAVTTDVGNVREVIRDGVDGLIASNDVVDITSKICTLYYNDDLRIKMGSSAQKRVQTLFSKEIAGQRLKAIYQSLYQS